MEYKSEKVNYKEISLSFDSCEDGQEVCGFEAKKNFFGRLMGSQMKHNKRLFHLEGWPYNFY